MSCMFVCISYGMMKCQIWSRYLSFALLPAHFMEELDQDGNFMGTLFFVYWIFWRSFFGGSGYVAICQ